VIIEVKAMDFGLVTVDAKALANDIARTGHVSVFGIYFDSGKSDLKPESNLPWMILPNFCMNDPI